MALDFLREKGLALVTRNFRCRLGELDLIMNDDGCLVIVEVRYRAANRFASAAHTVDFRKQQKIVRATAYYLGRNPRLAEAPVRFDIIAIDGASDGDDRIQWTRDAFRT